MLLKKYIILVVIFSVHYFEAMDGPPITTPIKTMIWTTEMYNAGLGYSPCDIALLDIIEQHSFKDSTVLAYDNVESITKKIAQTAREVHLDNTFIPNPEQTELGYHYANIHNIICTEPQQNKYDYIVICNPQELKKNIIQENFRICYPLLTSAGTGKLLCVLRLTTDRCILQTGLDFLYPKIYQAIPRKTKLYLKLGRTQNFDTYLLSSTELVNTCAIHNLFSCDELPPNIQCLFTIEPKEKKAYNIIIENEDMYRNWLKLIFESSVKECDIPHETMQSLQEQYVTLIIHNVPRNTEGYLMHPFRMTEVVWRKSMIELHNQKNQPRPKSSSCPTPRQKDHKDL